MNDTIRSSIEEELVNRRRLVYSNVGDSMWPLIREGKDLLVIERPGEWDYLPAGTLTKKLKKYDIPLYKRDGGKVYVLHRVVDIKDNSYVLCGDNRRNREYGINDGNVTGVLTGIIRNNKEIPLTGLKYKCYVHLWCDFFYIRAGVILIRDLLRRITHRKTYIKIDRH